MVAEHLKSDERDSTMQASTERDFFRSTRLVIVVEIGSCGGVIWPWDKEEKRKGRKKRRCLWWKCNLTMRVKKWDQMKWRVLTIHGRGVEMRVKKWDQMKWDKYKGKRDKEHRKW